VTETERFDDALLTAFMSGFYGYGDYHGRYWFVGKEEGGHGTFDEANRRSHDWTSRGRPDLEDAADYARFLGGSPWFRERPRVQPTWGKLIRILLAAEDQPRDANALRWYQRDSFGRYGSDTCSLELLPLPAPSTGHWMYSAHSALPELATRDSYRSTVSRYRAEHLKARVDQYRPHALIFYSSDAWYRRWWYEIAPVTLEPIAGTPIVAGHYHATAVVVMPHPTSFGMSNAICDRIGQLIGR